MATDSPPGSVATLRPAKSGGRLTGGGRLQGIWLARRAARGDRGAFEQIFERHHQELYRYCLAILGDRHDAEDALQETMAAALRALPGEDRDIDIRPWLFRIAHNESISLRRRRQLETIDELDIPEREGASQDDRLETRDRLRRLVADLGEMPERQCSALVMRELSGLSYAEIGDALSCSNGGARQAVFEARTALREREEGREMECDEIRRAISERDGRRLRGRKMRAHLNVCDGCHAFAVAIPDRRANMQSLCPPMSAAVAGTMLTGLLGGAGGGAASGAAGIASSGIATSVAIKGGSIAAAVALAAGAADVGGLIDLPNPIGAGKQSSAKNSEAEPAGSGGSTTTGGSSADRGVHRDGGGPGGQNGDHGQNGSGRGNGNGGSSAISPGNSGNAPAASQGSGSSSAGAGNSGSAPGQTGTSPGGGSADAPGQTGILPGNAATAPGHTGTAAGNSATAPGQTDSVPPGQVDNPGSAKGNGAPAGPKPK